MLPRSPGIYAGEVHQTLVGPALAAESPSSAPPYPKAVVDAHRRFASEVLRYITVIADHRKGMGGFEVLSGPWNIWSRATLASKIEADVAYWRGQSSSEADLAAMLIGSIRDSAACAPASDDDEAATKKLAAWLTLHAANASDERIASQALKLLGLDPKRIFAATRRKAQRSRQVERENGAEKRTPRP